MFGKGVFLGVFELYFLNTEFRKLLLLVINFQIILFNNNFVNILKNCKSYCLDYMSITFIKKHTHTKYTIIYLFFTFEKTLLEI